MYYNNIHIHIYIYIYIYTTKECPGLSLVEGSWAALPA